MTKNKTTVTHNTWYVTSDTWHLTHDTWHIYIYIYISLPVRFCPLWYRCYFLSEYVECDDNDEYNKDNDKTTTKTSTLKTSTTNTIARKTAMTKTKPNLKENYFIPFEEVLLSPNFEKLCGLLDAWFFIYILCQARGLCLLISIIIIVF